MYKKSIYNYIYEHDEKQFVLFNTFSGAIIKINEEFLTKLLTDITLFNHNELSKLVELGVIVPQNYDEKEIITFDRSKGIYCDDTSTFRILTTTCCNARCEYCYENGIVHQNMSDVTAQAVLNFIKKQTTQTRKIKIQWFGGEPTLNHHIILSLTSELNGYAEEFNKEIEFSMITNGSLIHKVPFELFRLKRVQISLDGDYDVYSKTKKYINPEIDLWKIIDNINLLTSKNIFVSIRLNYDKFNLNSIHNLIPILNGKLQNKHKVRVYPYPLFSSYNGHLNISDGTTPKELSDLYISLVNNNLMQRSELIKLNYRKSRCFACSANSFVIGADGNLYKCTTDLITAIGNVFDGVKIGHDYLKWCTPTIDKSCEECIFLPLCQGGCMASQLNGHPVKCFAQKEIINDLLLLHIK